MEALKKIINAGGKTCAYCPGFFSALSMETVERCTIEQWSGLIVLEYPNARKVGDEIALCMIENLVKNGSRISPTAFDTALRSRYYTLARYMFEIESFTDHITPPLFIICGFFDWRREDDEMFDFLVSKGQSIHQSHEDMSLLEYVLNKTTISWRLVEKLLKLGAKDPWNVEKNIINTFLLVKIKIQNEQILLETGKNVDITTGLVDVLKMNE